MNNDTTNKIIIFAIGVLVGALVSVGAFCACTAMISANSNSSQTSQQGGTPPEMPSGQNGSNSQGGTPPEKPGSNNSQSNTQSDSKSSSNNS